MTPLNRYKWFQDIYGVQSSKLQCLCWKYSWGYRYRFVDRCGLVNYSLPHISPTQTVYKWIAWIGTRDFKIYVQSKIPKCSVNVWNKRHYESCASIQIFTSMLNKHKNYFDATLQTNHMINMLLILLFANNIHV